MRHEVLAGLLLTGFVGFVPYVWRVQQELPNTVEKPTVPIKAVIFDLGGVVFLNKTLPIIRHVGFGTLARYAVSHLVNPVTSLQERLMYLLSVLVERDKPLEVAQQELEPMWRGAVMPQLVCDWQCGRYTCQDMLTLVHNHADELWHEQQETGIQHFASELEKDIIKKILAFIFDAKTRIESMYQLGGADIVREVAQQQTEDGSKKYVMYVLSNIDNEEAALLQERYPDLFANFDGCVFSASEGYLKPDPRIYTALLERYTLDPHECVFIDNQIENVQAATQIGMTALHIPNKDFATLRNQLIALDVLSTG